MAARVNTRFVVLLSALLVLVFGAVATTAYFVLTQSGAELERLGDLKYAEGDYKGAMLLYGKAYAHDRNRADRLEKYRKAIAAWTPATESEYADAYNARSMGALVQLSKLQPTKVEPQEELLREMHEQLVLGGFTAEGGRNLATTATACIRPFERAPDAPSGWERLRRYRGLALVGIGQADRGEILAEDRDLVEPDLAAAVAADPEDDEAAVAVARWKRILAADAEEDRNPPAAVALRAEAETLVTDYIAGHPQSLRAPLLLLTIRLEGVLNDVRAEGSTTDVLQARIAAAATLAPDLDAVARAMSGAAARVSAPLLSELLMLERFITNNKSERTRGVIDAVLAVRSADAGVLALSARLAAEDGRFDDCIAAHERLQALPMPPVSLGGRLLWGQQTQSVYEQAGVVLAQWYQAPAEDKPALLATVKQLRESLNRRLPGNSPLLMLMDARIRFTEGDLTAAQRLLIDYNVRTQESDPDGVGLLAQVEENLKRPGEAARLWERAISLRPDNTIAYERLGALLLEMMRLDEADRVYRTLQRLDPRNESAAQKIAAIEALRGTATAEGDDPVLAVLSEALRTFRERPDGTPGDPDAAIALLEAYLRDHPPGDPRAYDTAIVLSAQSDRWEKARELGDAAVAAHPDNPRLQRLQTVVSVTDPVDRRLAEIEVGPGTDAEKAVSRYRVCVEFGRPEEAAEILASLQSRADDPVVAELLFVVALEKGDKEAAARLADAAAAKNLDRVNGLTFRARMQMNEGAKEAAITTLRQATKLGTATAETWRLLGALILEQGNEAEALAAFAEARRLKPNDLGSAMGYINTQVRLNQIAEALETARAIESFGRDNKQFMEIWLRLEEEVGDKRMAAARRETLLKQSPEDPGNRESLARLYTALTEWDKARALIDSLRAESDSLDLVRLDATWSADQGDFDRSEKVFRDYIATLGPADGPSPAHEAACVMMGQFLVARGVPEPGLAALREASAYQDPKTLGADRALGAALFDLRGRDEEAVEVLRRVVDAGADDAEHSMRSRLVESLVALQRYDEADRVISALGEPAESNMVLMLLRAVILNERGEDAKAKDLLDRLVTDFPDEPLVYVKRAETLRKRQDLLRDALTDCTTALRLRSNYWQALQLRSVIQEELGDRDAAMADLRAAVKINPAMDGARDALIREYLAKGKTEDAFAVATEAIDQNPRDLPPIVGIGDIFFDASAWTQAAAIYERAWAISKAGPVAARYSLALLRTPNPNLTRVDDVLAAPEARVETAPPLLMTRAMLRVRQDRGRDARQDAAKAIQLTIKEMGREQVGMMIDRLMDIFREPGEIVDFMNQHLDFSPLPDQWAYVYRAQLLMTDPQATIRAQAEPLLVDAIAKSQDPDCKRTARRFLGAILMDARRYEDMVALCRGGLGENPDDIELNNNIAYVLCEHLGRAEEALPHAQKAVEKDPRSPQVLDTLGVVFLRLNRLDEADETLTRARAAYAPPDVHLACTLHQGLAKAAKQDRQAAEDLLRTAENILKDVPALSDDYKKPMTELREKIAQIR